MLSTTMWRAVSRGQGDSRHFISSSGCHQERRIWTSTPTPTLYSLHLAPSNFYLFPTLKEYIRGRRVVLETAVSVSRALETNFMRSWSWSWSWEARSWSWSWYLWSWSWTRSWRVGLEKFQDQLCMSQCNIAFCNFNSFVIKQVAQLWQRDRASSAISRKRG